MNNTKTKPTDQKESTLHPEIKKKAAELFDLIEDGHDGTANTAEEMAEEMKSQLSREGFQQLLHAYRISAPQSQLSEHNLEASIWYMQDDTLKSLQELANKTHKIAHILFSEDKDREVNTYYLKKITDETKEQADKINRLINSEWEHRAEEYKSELQEMKGDK